MFEPDEKLWVLDNHFLLGFHWLSGLPCCATIKNAQRFAYCTPASAALFILIFLLLSLTTSSIHQ